MGYCLVLLIFFFLFVTRASALSSSVNWWWVSGIRAFPHAPFSTTHERGLRCTLRIDVVDSWGPAFLRTRQNWDVSRGKCLYLIQLALSAAIISFRKSKHDLSVTRHLSHDRRVQQRAVKVKDVCSTFCIAPSRIERHLVTQFVYTFFAFQH